VNEVDATTAKLRGLAIARTSIPDGRSISTIISAPASIYDGEQCVAQHVLQPPALGWATVPAHHAALWADTLAVEQRSLAVYEEVATWN
jgi:hypothetical protein